MAAAFGCRGGSAGFGRFRDVWRSGNGADWHLVTATAAFSARNAHQMVSHRGSLWLLGGAAGNRGGKQLNDVWRSANGSVWVEVTVVGKTFAKRNGHQAFSYRGSLWVVGGNNNAGFDFNDVWRSADGEDWELVTTAVRRFGGRQQHQVAVHTIPFVYQGTAVVVRGPEEFAFGCFRRTSCRRRWATLTASGGIGRLRFDVMADAQGVATVGADDGVLAATAFVEGVSTVTVRVRDETPGK